MKTGLFINGLTIGVIIGFCLTKMFCSSTTTTTNQSYENAVTTANKNEFCKMAMAESLEAVKAATNCHDLRVVVFRVELKNNQKLISEERIFCMVQAISGRMFFSLRTVYNKKMFDDFQTPFVGYNISPLFFNCIFTV